MTTICFKFSHGRLFWLDEEYSRQVLLDPSFLHMITGWREGADSGGLFQYLLARLWIGAFGMSELTLRLFSTFGVFISFVVTWFAARRYFSIFPVAVGLSLIFLTSPCILWQYVNGRFYGLLLAAAALACASFLRTAQREILSATDLASVFVANLLLIGSHILGIVYSASLLLTILAADRYRGRFRPSLYLAMMVPWLSLAYYYRAVINTTSITKDKFWTLKPSFQNLVSAQLAFDPVVKIVMGLLIVCLIVIALRTRTPAATMAWKGKLRDTPWVWLIAALAIAELAIFIKSRIGISLWSDRYLLPVELGTAFLLAALIAKIGEMLVPHDRKVFTAPTALCITLLCFVWALNKPVHGELYPAPNSPRLLEAMLPPNHTVLIADLSLFLMMRTYDPGHQYQYPVDGSYDDLPAHAAEDHAGDHLMENWRRAGYGGGDLPDCTAIYEGPTRFTLLLADDHKQWMAYRLQSNPAFEITQTGSFNQGASISIWDVQRRGSAGSCRYVNR